MPTSNLIGRIRFIPVERSKAILVLSPVEYQQSVKQMIEELDKPGKQVMVKAVIVQVDHSKMTSLGVQIATDPTAFGVLTENSAEAVTKLSYLDTHGAWTLDMSTNVTTLVDLLIKKANAKVLNQPTLWMKDNEEAIFFKGQNVAFIEGSQTDNTGAALKTTFNYKDVGVTLRVRPNITPENNVGIIINLIVEQVEPQLINTQVATNKLDTLTHMIVKDGETIMLGGILFQTDSKIHRKIPLLGDLPLIGAVFNHWDVQVANSELLVFITPYVVEDTDRGTGQEVLDEAGDKFDTIVQDMEQSMQEITDPNFNTD
jgi:general secretion pathway protein D